MKKMLLLFILFSSYIHSQINIDSLLTKRQEIVFSINNNIKELNLQSEIIRDCDKAIQRFNDVKRELLSIDDLSNKQLQKIIIQPLADEYGDYFTIKSEGKEVNTLKYGFESKASLENQLKIIEATLLGNVFEKKYRLIIDYNNSLENYINKNLKRLGISRKSWDDMTDNDQNLLIDKFEK